MLMYNVELINGMIKQKGENLLRFGLNMKKLEERKDKDQKQARSSSHSPAKRI